MKSYHEFSKELEVIMKSTKAEESVDKLQQILNTIHRLNFSNTEVPESLHKKFEEEFNNLQSIISIQNEQLDCLFDKYKKINQ